MKLPELTSTGGICPYNGVIFSVHQRTTMSTAVNSDRIINLSWSLFFFLSYVFHTGTTKYLWKFTSEVFHCQVSKSL